MGWEKRNYIKLVARKRSVEELIKKLISLNKTKKLKIICVGDSVIDIYRYGEIEKISQEFPIPILHSSNENKNEEFVLPGGSSNVANQFRHFNSDIFNICFCDKELERTLHKNDLNTDFCISLVSGFIPKKIRYYNNNFPLLRHDIETNNYGESDDFLKELRKEALCQFNEIMFNNKIDAVILSDYNKGFWDDDIAQHIIKECNKHNIITIVDPKVKPLDRWKGCSVLKLNSKEAQLLTQCKDKENQAHLLQKETNCESVIITDSGFGVYGKKEEYFEYKPTRISQEVNSTIGAGDFFAAILAVLLCNDIDIVESCKIAFAGGIEYVKNRHNKPITLYDICANIDKISSKIMPLEDLVYIKEKIYKNEKLVFTNGCFDCGLTSAHVYYLQEAKKMGDKLVVAINSDKSVERLKGEGRPVMSLKERMQVVAGLECVDYVIFFEEDTPLEIIKKIMPDLIVKGGYKKEEVVGYEIVDVEVIEKIESISTTEKIKRSNFLDWINSQTEKSLLKS